MADGTDALRALVEQITTCSPERGELVCKALDTVSGFLLGLQDPRAVGFGTGLAALTQIFRLRGRARRKAR